MRGISEKFCIFARRFVNTEQYELHRNGTTGTAERCRYHKIWTDFLAGRYSLCVSNEIPFPQLNVLTLDEFNETLR